MTRLTLVLVTMLCAACGQGTPTSPTHTLLETTMTTEVFSGTLAQGGSKFYSYSVSSPGSSTAMLASLTTGATGPAPDARVVLGLGTPAGTGCAAAQFLAVSPALTVQLLRSTTPGIYCVSITDAGTLSQDTGFAIRLEHP
jgi:hypothetical protein